MFDARNEAVQSFHTQLVDYAGIFPPASLPFEIAVRCFSAYLQEKNPWMIARFVCPHHRFKDLLSYESLFPDGCPIAVLIKVTDAKQVVDAAEEAKTNLLLLKGSPFKLSSLEITLPPTTPDDSLLLFLKEVEEAVDQFSVDEPPFAFFEWPLSESHLWRRSDDLRQNVSNMKLGLKARCGGVLPDHFPSTKDVASFVRYCIEHNVPFKCTAGLHHPVRQVDPKIGVHMHGYWNVFASAILGRVHDLDHNKIEEIICESDPDSFSFEGDAFGYKDLPATGNEVTAARKELAISFGSCSFDEPREELRAAGYCH